jgi:hypothetical protein
MEEQLTAVVVVVVVIQFNYLCAATTAKMPVTDTVQ